jgi:hypothetical protein
VPVDARNPLVLEFAEKVRTLQERSSAGVRATLDELTASAAAAMPNADHVGITVVDRRGAVSTVGPTHRTARLLDKIQDTVREGPCLAAAWQQHVMRIDDMSTETRWPRYRRDAIELTPVRSVVSFQLFVEAKAMAALNFYAERPHAFDEESVEIGLIFATHTAIAWNVIRRDDQFRSALASRDIIGQAKGMLMERFKVDAVHAFELLKRLSQDSNTPLAKVAEQLVRAERTNDE